MLQLLLHVQDSAEKCMLIAHRVCVLWNSSYIVVFNCCVYAFNYYTIQDAGEIIWYHWKSNWNSLKTASMHETS